MKKPKRKPQKAKTPRSRRRRKNKAPAHWEPPRSRSWRGGTEPLDLPSIPAPRHDMERLNQMISRMIQKQGLENIDDINAFLDETLVGKNLDKLREDDELDAAHFAQDLAYDAMDADSGEESLELAQQALEYDPDCVDAMMQVALLQGRTSKAQLKNVLEVISKVEAHLGEEYFEEHRGYFWGLVETRPYMRALSTSVTLLRGQEKLDEAVATCERMLDLNPNDNQGIRDTLLGLYLQTRNLQGCSRLFKRYEESHLAVFAWGRVLERFLSGDREGARKAISKAKKSNRFVIKYLTGQKSLPDHPPDFYSTGDENEAVHCMDEQALAWVEFPSAMRWLHELTDRT